MSKYNLEDILSNPENFELVDVYEEYETGEVFIEHDPWTKETHLAGYLIRVKQGDTQ